MTNLLADLPPGMADPVAGAQACFRTLLDAMARPGRVLALPGAATAGVGLPLARDGEPAFGHGTAALLLTLLDAETHVRLPGRADSEAARAWLRFHTGVRAATGEAPADFTLARSAEWSATNWQSIDLGTDEAPQRGGTLIIEVTWLDAPGHGGQLSDAAGALPCTTLDLRGPGIAERQRLVVGGLPPAFWAHRQSLRPLFPRGVDLVLVCGRHLAALPRTTRLAIES